LLFVKSAAAEKGITMETNDKIKRGLFSRMKAFTSGIRNYVAASTSFIESAASPMHFTILIIFLPLFFTTQNRLTAQELQSTYKIAVERENEPYEFLNEKNKADGYIPSLLRQVEKLAGITFEFIPLPLPEAGTALDNGEVDIVNMIYSPEKETHYAFSIPICKITQALFCYRKSENIKDTSTLTGAKVGFKVDDISQKYLQNRRDFHQLIFDEKLDGLLSLNIGELDAFFCAEQSGIHLATKYNFNNINLIERGLFPQEFVFATHKTNGRLISVMNDALVQLQQSGKLNELKKQWLAGEMISPGWFVHNQEYLFSIATH